jgi:TonB family protein
MLYSANDDLSIWGLFVKILLACLLVAVWASRSPAEPQAKDGSESRQRKDMTPAKLLNKVEPKYPAEARRQRVSGTVRLHAIIRKDGSVGDLQAISGDSLLTQAAIDAVQQWRYSPTLLNGKPVEVDTTIDVSFQLYVLHNPKGSQ